MTQPEKIFDTYNKTCLPPQDRLAFSNRSIIFTRTRKKMTQLSTPKYIAFDVGEEFLLDTDIAASRTRAQAIAAEAAATGYAKAGTYHPQEKDIFPVLSGHYILFDRISPNHRLGPTMSHAILFVAQCGAVYQHYGANILPPADVAAAFASNAF